MTSTGSQPPAGGLRTIVVGYDGTSPAERALARAAELARAFGSTVIVADVAAPAPVEAMRQQHRGRVESFFADTGIAHEFDGVVGDPAAEIVDVAERRNADLIVVGTREPGLLDRLLAGSVSQGVARRARCDVLIVHPQLDD